MHSVLFVCTANQCRSPMAEGLLRLRVGLNNPEWRIGSAGTWTSDGLPATNNAIEVLSELDYDLSDHRSRQVDQHILASYQLVLVMERNHKEALKVEFPKLAGRIFLLSEMIDKNYNIDDPIGGPLVEYQTTANEIEQILKQSFDRIEILSTELD